MRQSFPDLDGDETFSFPSFVGEEDENVILCPNVGGKFELNGEANRPGAYSRGAGSVTVKGIIGSGAVSLRGLLDVGRATRKATR